VPTCIDLPWGKVCIPTLEDIGQQVSGLLGDTYSQLISDVYDAVPDFLKNVFGTAWSGAIDLFSDFLGVINESWNSLQDFISPYLNTLNEWWNSFYGSFEYFTGIIGDGINNLIKNISDSFGGFADWLLGGLGDLFGNLWDSLTGGLNFLWEGMKSIGEIINNVSGAAIGAIGEGFGGIGGILADGFSAFTNGVLAIPEMFNGALGTIGTMLSGIGDFFFSAVANRVADIPGLGASFGEMIFGFIEDAINIFSTAISQLVKGVTAVDLAKLAKGRGFYLPIPWGEILTGGGIPAISNALAEALNKIVINILDTDKPVSVEGAKKNIIEYLSFITQFSILEISARIWETIVGAILGSKVLGSGLGGKIIGNTRPLSSLIRSLYFNMGLGWLTWAIFGDLLRATITQPMRVYYNELYRPEYLQRSQIDELYRRGFIDSDTAKGMYAKLGYRDEYVEMIMSIAQYYPPPSEVQEMFRRRIINEEKARELLTRFGVKGELQDWYIENAHYRMSADVIASLVKKRMVDEEYGKKLFADYGYPDEWLDLLIEDSYNQINYSLTFELYENGLISGDDIPYFLRLAGYDEKVIPLLTELGRIRAISDERGKLITRLGNALAKGYITEDEFKRIAVGYGIPEEQTELLIYAYKTEYRYDFIDDFIMSIRRAYRDGKISEEYFRILLSIYLDDLDAIETIIAYEKSMKGDEPFVVHMPQFINEPEMLSRAVIGIERQIRSLNERMGKELEVLTRMVSALRDLKRRVPAEQKEIIDEMIEEREKMLEERKKYYSKMLLKLSYYYQLYKQLRDVFV